MEYRGTESKSKVWDKKWEKELWKMVQKKIKVTKEKAERKDKMVEKNARGGKRWKET